MKLSEAEALKSVRLNVVLEELRARAMCLGGSRRGRTGEVHARIVPTANEPMVAEMGKNRERGSGQVNVEMKSKFFLRIMKIYPHEFEFLISQGELFRRLISSQSGYISPFLTSLFLVFQDDKTFLYRTRDV